MTEKQRETRTEFKQAVLSEDGGEKASSFSQFGNDGPQYGQVGKHELMDVTH